MTPADLIPEDIDEQLTEEDALAQSKAEGIEFVDYYTVDVLLDELDQPVRFNTKEEAEEVAGDKAIYQTRIQKQGE